MGKKWLHVMRYLISHEDSRPGHMDFWNSVFLAGKTPLHRCTLELSKVFLLLGLSACITLALTHHCM